MDTTQILADIKEYIRYPNGIIVREKIHHIALKIPDKYVYFPNRKGIVNLTELRKEAKKIILKELSTGHELFIQLHFYNPYKGEGESYTADYIPTKIKFELPPEYRKTNSEGNSFDDFMKKSMDGAKKAKGLLDKGMDWFFMEGKYAEPKKTATKKTTAKKKTTNKKKR